MTTLTPILYADGALRLTDHGPRGGGLVLKHEGGLQVDIHYQHDGTGPAMARSIGHRIERMLHCNYEPAVVVAQVAKIYDTEPH